VLILTYKLNLCIIIIINNGRYIRTDVHTDGRTFESHIDIIRSTLRSRSKNQRVCVTLDNVTNATMDNQLNSTHLEK